jgi:hypothetical protein
MKRWIVLIVCLTLFAFVGSALAQDNEVAVPTPVPGTTDLLVPDSLIKTVSNDPNPKVLAVFHDVVPVKSQVEMYRKGKNWVIPGGVDADVHPAVVQGDKLVWTRVEDVWATSSDFIKYRGPGKPCIHYKSK